MLAAAIELSVAAAQDMQASFTTPTEHTKYVVEIEVISPGPVSSIIPNADVRLMGPGDGEGPKGHEIDRNGHARFLNLASGKYKVWATADGFGYLQMDLNVPTQDADAMHGVVKLNLTLPVSEEMAVCEIACNATAAEGAETTTSTLGDRLDMIPLPFPVAPPIPPLAPHRNSVARFFSGIGHKLGF